VLADINSHIVWEGEQAPKKNFRLLTMDAPPGPASVGTRFSSTGANSKDGSSTFTDHSIVVEASPGVAFAFETDASLSRRHAKMWLAHFSHRYAIEPAAGGSTVRYTAEVRPTNYIPYWLRPWFRPMTRTMVQAMHRRHMLNLTRMAEGSLERA
jgi:Polyketide cyclase / dehydrase and lipid transport